MTKKSITEIQKHIIYDFSVFENWEGKYEYILDLGKTQKSLKNIRNESNRIKVCQSQVWLLKEDENNQVFFFAESDSQFIQGILSLLVKVLTGQKKEKIKNCKLFFLENIDLINHLSPVRQKGLNSIISKMKDL